MSNSKNNPLGENIKMRRKSLGLTQVELADLSGVSVRAIISFERGSSSISTKRFLAILNTLGLEIDLKVRVSA